MKITTKEKDAAITALRNILSPGDKVRCVLRHVSASGMSRTIDFYSIRDESMIYLSGYIAKVLGLRHGKHSGLVVTGCGMDMGFATVYDLSWRLFPDGFGVTGTMPMGHEIRPASREDAATAVELGAKFRGRNGDASGWDDDGGYALRHEWV